VFTVSQGECIHRNTSLSLYILILVNSHSTILQNKAREAREAELEEARKRAAEEKRRIAEQKAQEEVPSSNSYSRSSSSSQEMRRKKEEERRKEEEERLKTTGTGIAKFNAFREAEVRRLSCPHTHEKAFYHCFFSFARRKRGRGSWRPWPAA
jgi:hypothetical protein